MVILVGMRFDNRVLLTGTCGFVVTSAIVQGMKRVLFSGQLRPMALIPANVPVHLVEGMMPNTHFSFPSGHAATIFAAICLIHFLVAKKPLWLSLMLLILACTVAYSRIYLCQHFYRDIYVGGLIGTCTMALVYGILKNWPGPSWLDQRFLARLAVLWRVNNR